MSTTLVTAIYHGEREGKFGGRDWHEQYYFSSLQNLYNFGLPMVIYCSGSGYHKIKAYLEYLDTLGEQQKWSVIVSELGDFKYADNILSHRQRCIKYFKDQIEEIRKTNPNEPGLFHTRCEILCHQKIYFLKNTAHFNPYNTDNFCWVDAGITHWSLTPYTKGGVEINNFFDKTHYYPLNPNNIYTPEIGPGLDRLISDHKLIQFKHGNIWYHTSHVQLLRRLLEDKYGMKYEDTDMTEQLVGGVIGIHPSEFDALIDFYEHALVLLSSVHPPHTDFFTEEIILSAYYKLRNHYCIHFEEWPHDSEEDPGFVDFGDDLNKQRKHKLLFYKVWDVVKKY